MRYIGSKRLLINEIDDILCRHLTGDESSFLDLFGGTNVVGNAFKKSSPYTATICSTLAICMEKQL